MIKISFSSNTITKLGEEVFIAGNIGELGAWNPHQAHKLYTSQKKYPEWESLHPIEIYPETCIEFKTVIIGNNGKIRWESLPQNR